ncbi:MAG: UDP-N-acetylmuramoyl-L-alanyl-D-glutamate--2,6-diaminopimelate ligase [Candidatus Omnitrophota bacterium]
MRLSDVLKKVEYKRAAGAGVSADPEIERVTKDSRLVGRGDLFVAFRGYARDGHGFIDEAVARGAAAIAAEKDFEAPGGIVKILVKDTRAALPVIADNFYGHPSQRLTTVGVTGTNGKTTITYIIESILKAAGIQPGVVGTISYRIGGKIVPASNTTPGPIELQELLAEIARLPRPCAVMEVSSHALDQRRTCGVKYDAAIFTNITPEHLDYHKTLEDYFAAKTRIFAALKDGGVAILNNDDKRVAALKRSIKKRVITYALKKGADISATNIRLSLDGSSFDMISPEGSFSVSTRLIGRHNVSNILASAAACRALGVDRETIKKGVGALQFVPGRCESVECGQPFKVFVDFAHTEDALRNVLSLLREVSKADVITVFGCGGNRDRAKRPLMGRAACRLSDSVVITSDNPRSENPSAIIDEIVGGVRGEFSNYEVETDRRRAIEKAFDAAGAGSIVVIAGKGHETGQIVGDKVLPFDDRVVAGEILSKVGRLVDSV